MTRSHRRSSLENRRSDAVDRSPTSPSSWTQPYDNRRHSVSYDAKNSGAERDIYPETLRSSSPTGHVHPMRSRYMEPGGQNDREREPKNFPRVPWPTDDYDNHSAGIHGPFPPSRTSRAPTSTRHPQKSPGDLPPLSRDYSQADHHFFDSDADAPQRPPAQRTTSLLDRLTDGPAMDADAPPLQSLRDRVEPPLKRPAEEIHGLPPRPPPSEGSFTIGETDMSGRGGRGGKKRLGKPKRGRR